MSAQLTDNVTGATGTAWTTSTTPSTSASKVTFEQYAVAGQKKLKSGDRKGAVPLYASALKVGTPNRVMLGVVHSQLGNCLLSLGMYEMAIRNHRADLDIALNELKDFAGAAQSWANLGNAYKGKPDFGSASRCFEQQLLIALANLGMNYETAGFYMFEMNKEQAAAELLGKSRDAFLMQLRLSEQVKDLAGIGVACGYVGALYEKIGNPARAIPYYKRRLRLAQQVVDAHAEGRAYCNLGNVYRKLKKATKAITCYLRDIDICVTRVDESGEAITQGNLASAYQATGQIDLMEECLKRQCVIFAKLLQQASWFDCLGRLGELQLVVGTFKDAAETFKTQSELAETLKDEKAAAVALEQSTLARFRAANGETVEYTAAIAKLRVEQEDEDTTHTLQAKWSELKGTMSRVFGKRFKEKHLTKFDTSYQNPTYTPTKPTTTTTTTTPTAEAVATNVGHTDDIVKTKTTTTTKQDLKTTRRRSTATLLRKLKSAFQTRSSSDEMYLPPKPSIPSSALSSSSSLSSQRRNPAHTSHQTTDGQKISEPDGNLSDDSCDEDDFGLDELLFALAKIEEQASQRQEADLRNMGTHTPTKSDAHTPTKESSPHQTHVSSHPTTTHGSLLATTSPTHIVETPASNDVEHDEENDHDEDEDEGGVGGDHDEEDDEDEDGDGIGGGGYIQVEVDVDSDSGSDSARTTPTTTTPPAPTTTTPTTTPATATPTTTATPVKTKATSTTIPPTTMKPTRKKTKRKPASSENPTKIHEDLSKAAQEARERAEAAKAERDRIVEQLAKARQTKTQVISQPKNADSNA